MVQRSRKRKRVKLADVLAARYPKPQFDKAVHDDLVNGMPPFLNRKLWSEEDWERNRVSWDKIMKEERDKRAVERAKTDAEIFAKVRWHRIQKGIKAIRKEDRRLRKAERVARRVRKERVQSEHNDAVLEALAKGPQTAAQIAKRLGLERKDVSRALKRLLTVNRADKVSARVYCLPKPATTQRSPDKPRRRKRLSDYKRKKR